MTRVKIFRCSPGAGSNRDEILENKINQFIEENSIEVIDIKFSTCAIETGTALKWIPSAMMIYKTLD